MPKEYVAPAPFTDEPMPDIPLTPVTSKQVAAVGYDPLTKTLAVTFTRGTGAVYHYPNVEAKVHQEFMAAESIGKFFGQHIKALPFKKFPPPQAQCATAISTDTGGSGVERVWNGPVTSGGTAPPVRSGSPAGAWPFPSSGGTQG